MARIRSSFAMMALSTLPAFWTTIARAQEAAEPSAGAALSYTALAAITVGGAAAVGALVAVRNAQCHKMSALKADEARFSTEEALNALLLERADGAAIWAGEKLHVTVGCAKSLDELEDPGNVIAVAEMLVRTDHVPDVAHALQRLLEDGIPFDQRFSSLNGQPRLLSGATLGARAVVTIVDAKGPQDQLPRLTDRLVSAEERIDALNDGFDAAPIYAWRRDSEGRLEWVNRRFVDGVEAPGLDTVLTCQIELLSGDGGEVTRALARKAIETQTEQTERRATILDGSRRTLEIHERPYRNGTFGYAVDISAQVTAGEALVRQMRANEETLDRLHRGVAVFNADLRLTFANETLNGLWQLEPNWLETHPSLREILNALREENRLPHTRNFQAWRDEFIQACSEVSEPVERQWHLPGGAALHVMIQPHPMGGVMILFEDVTDYYAMRRDAATVSAVYHATFSRLSEGVIVFGLDGRCRLANTAFRESWGLSDATMEDMHISDISRKCSHLFSNTEVWSRAIGQISATTGSREIWTETLERTDGIVMGMASAPLPDGATMFAFQDITDSFNKERILREQNEKLGEISSLKGQFLESIHGASHELKIPLNTIVGFSDILTQEMCGKLNVRQHEYIDGISQASNELLQLIGGIIDLAMLEADYFEFCIESVDIRPMLSSVVDFITRNTSKGARVSLECPPDIGTIPGDAPRFREIMHTLVSAIRNEAGAGECIEVGVRRDDNGVAIWIGSRSSGIPLSIRDIFGRNDLSNSIPELRRVELGITLVRQFVQRQGGSIAIESNWGQTREAVVCRMLTDADAVRSAINSQSNYPATPTDEPKIRAAIPSR